MRRIIVLCVVFSWVVNSHAQNYDELKVPAYTLPALLKTVAGKSVNTVSDWEKIRRPEIVSLFEDNVYGQMPKQFDSIRFVVGNDIKNVMAGRAELKEIQINVWKNGKRVSIHLIEFIPNSRRKAAPVFLLINNRAPDRTDPTRAIKAQFWPAETLIDSGYAVAAFHVSDAAPDNADHFQDGVLQLYPEQLTMPNGMKAIGAWAWAASRIMDYFEQDQSIDAKKVMVVGHSRGGKAALWTGAQDKRFAMVFANCSGNTGVAIARRQYGETIKKINSSFPYWFCDNYKKFNDNVDSLPVDQHMLVSLIAPRPLYTTNASKDLWADPTGSFLSLNEVEPVYALYGKKSNLSKIAPAQGDAIIASVMGYHIREGIHDLTLFDWVNFIRFANYHIPKMK
ncbi:MAG: hypothetical protein ABIU63_00205 [Chitinophagaceae bacterium]